MGRQKRTAKCLRHARTKGKAKNTRAVFGARKPRTATIIAKLLSCLSAAWKWTWRSVTARAAKRNKAAKNA